MINFTETTLANLFLNRVYRFGGKPFLYYKSGEEWNHYTWDEMENGGFSLFGNIWEAYRAKLGGLEAAPTADNLKNASVYVMVDPDGYKDTKKPNFMDERSAAEIASWVKQGGVLLLMTNDTANCDLEHFNILSDKFGIHFLDKSRNMVKNNEFETGAIYNKTINPVFKQTKKMYLKEISVMQVKQPATALITQDGDVIFATAKYVNTSTQKNVEASEEKFLLSTKILQQPVNWYNGC